MITTLDLEPGIYAVSAFTVLEIYTVADCKKDKPVKLAEGKKVRLYAPEGGQFEVHTKLFPPKVSSIQLTDPVDPIPHEGLLTEPQPLTLQEQIARFLGSELAKQNQSIETMEESDDFDVDDDDDLPLSRYEIPDADPEYAPAPRSPKQEKGQTQNPPSTTDQPKEERSDDPETAP